MAKQKKMRADKKKSVDKVAAALVKNPLASQREIAKETGLGKSTVDRAEKEVGQVGAKDARIQHLLDLDYQVVELTTQENLGRIKDKQKVGRISARDLTYIGDVSAKRYSTFAGEVTDEKGAYKYSDWTDDKLNENIDRRLNQKLNS